MAERDGQMKERRWENTFISKGIYEEAGGCLDAYNISVLLTSALD